MAVGMPEWERRYARKLVVTDFLVVVAAVATAQVLRFGLDSSEVNVPLSQRSQFAVSYTLISVLLVLAWLLALSVFDTRDRKIFGIGPEEYKRVINATFATFGALAILAFLLKSQIGRGYLLIALPIGLVLIVLGRWLWRKRLHRHRNRHSHVYRTLIVGQSEKSAHVAREISRNRYAGFGLLGAVTEPGSDTELLPGLPVVASYDGLIEAIDERRIDTVIVISSDAIGPERMRQIGWELESRRVNLVVAAALTDIAGPRIHTRPVSGLPLIHVEYPEFTGRKQLGKRLFDLVCSALLLILLSPLLLVIALCVKFGSPGPVFFRQQRVGLSGAPFKMLKFRSMVVDAEDRLDGLLDQSDGNGFLFKLKQDPRVTPVGGVLRKYSLDELPQLVNVFLGEMSLVGPRPPLPKEVDQYEDWVHRRLLVKPGITGLWQVSGRSDLSWEDSVRLDLYYVENWSMTGDLVILWRTVKTVLRPEGAY